MTFNIGNQKGYATHINNASYSSYNAVVSGLDINSYNNMTISINSGEVVYRGNKETVSSTDVTLSEGDSNYPRIDLIAYDGNTLIVIEGIAESYPNVPTYTPENYTLLYQVYVDTNQSSLSSSDVTDLKCPILNLSNNISDLQDVSTNNLTNNDLLIYNGSNWENKIVDTGGYFKLPRIDLINSSNRKKCIQSIRGNFTRQLYGTSTYTSGASHGVSGTSFWGGVLAPNGKIILVPHDSSNVGIYNPETDTYTTGASHGENEFPFNGGVLAPNGKVIFVPSDSDNVGIYDPETDTYTSGASHGEGNAAFSGGVLAPNGNVIFVPYFSNNVGIYNPETDTYTSGASHGEADIAYIGGVLTPSGKIILVPNEATYVGIYDPETDTHSYGAAHGEFSDAFKGGVLTPNGKIIFIPSFDSYIGIYDPETDTFTSGAYVEYGNYAYKGAVLAPNGKVILVPDEANYIGIYDPETDTFTQDVTHGEGSGAFLGGVLTPNGKIIFVPYGSSNVGIYNLSGNPNTDINILLHPFVNKF